MKGGIEGTCTELIESRLALYLSLQKRNINVRHGATWFRRSHSIESDYNSSTNEGFYFGVFIHMITILCLP